MLDVFPLSYGFLVPQCRHTVTVLSTNLFLPSLYLTGKPKCSHLNDAGRLCSSVPPLAMTMLHLTSVWTEHAHNFFFFINQSADHACAEPKILIRMDHGSMMIRCTTTAMCAQCFSPLCIHLLTHITSPAIDVCVL